MRVSVRLAPVLAVLAEDRRTLTIELDEGATVDELLERLATLHPAIGRRVRDERGAVRTHVNVFRGPDNIRDLDGLATALADGQEVTILPAISGGATEGVEPWTSESESPTPSRERRAPCCSIGPVAPTPPGSRRCRRSGPSRTRASRS